MGDGIELEVTDTGIGISADDVEKLCTRLFRTPQPKARMAPGTGLGLSIVQSIVEALAGRVSVESEIGRGSTLRVRLPHVED